MKNLRICYTISFILTAFVVGVLFHGYRIHPENTTNYNLGVTMGLSMLSLFALFFAIGIFLLIIYRNNVQFIKNTNSNEIAELSTFSLLSCGNLEYI